MPTGWFADRFGHRASLIVGSAVQVLAMLCCWLGSGVPELVVASLLVALGDGFRSGADEALLFRTCAAMDREVEFLAMASRAHTLEVCALVTLVVGGGAIATAWGYHAAWAAETALSAIGVGLACAMREPPPTAADDARGGAGAGSAGRGSAARFLALVAPVAFLGGAAAAASFMAQTTGAGSARELTVLVALIAAAEAGGAALAPRVPATGIRGLGALAIAGLALIAGALAAPIVFPVAVVGLAFLEGLGEPLRAAAIQRDAYDGARARVASIANACDMIGSLLALLLAGLWVGRWPWISTW